MREPKFSDEPCYGKEFEVQSKICRVCLANQSCQQKFLKRLGVSKPCAITQWQWFITHKTQSLKKTVLAPKSSPCIETAPELPGILLAPEAPAPPQEVRQDAA